MKRITVILFSLIAVLLLAGFSSCKQEAGTASEKNLDAALIEAETISEGITSASINSGLSGVSIPDWEISKDGYHNIPAAVTSGTETGVTKAIKAGLKNPPALKDVKNLIVIVCEGLTNELIESSASTYGELILNSFPVKGTTGSKFTSSSGKTLTKYLMSDQFKTITGIASWGETSSNSLRRMTTSDDNSVAAKTVNYNQFMLSPALRLIIGKGDFEDALSIDTLNFNKAGGRDVTTLEEAIPLYKNTEVKFIEHTGSVTKLYCIFENDETLPSFRQELAFSLAWMQWRMDMDGFCLLSAYCPSSELDANDVQDFDEGVAVAVKFVLENPDTALLVCGCPVDGSVEDVCFFGLGKGVSAQSTLYECVSSLFE